MRSLRVVIFAIGGLLWLAVNGAWAAEYTFSYQKIIDLEQQVVPHLSLVRGSVYISGSEDDRLIIEAVKSIRATDENEVEGDIRIKSSSATITIQQIRGAIDLVTLSGEVKIQTELDSPRDYFVETNSGSITFIIPEASSGVLNIETQSGDVQAEMPVAVKSVSRNRLVGEFGRGGPTIRLSSSSGDVTVALY